MHITGDKIQQVKRNKRKSASLYKCTKYDERFSNATQPNMSIKHFLKKIYTVINNYPICGKF